MSDLAIYRQVDDRVEMTLPRGSSQKTWDHLVFAAESFSFLLPLDAKVSYQQFASMIRGYSVDPRAQFLSVLLESFSN